MQEELFGPEEYRQVVAYHYRMARHHLFKAQTYRDHEKVRYGVQLPLFREDGDEDDGDAANRVTTSFTLVRNEAGSRAPCNSASMNTFLLWPWRLVYCLRPP